MFNHNTNPNEVVDNKPTLFNDLGNNLAYDNIIPVIGIYAISWLNQIGKIPAQKHEKSQSNAIMQTQPYLMDL